MRSKIGTYVINKLTLRTRPTTSLALQLLVDVSRHPLALHACDGLSSRSQMKLMWTCTATTTSDSSLQMWLLYAVTVCFCNCISECVGPARCIAQTHLAQPHCSTRVLPFVKDLALASHTAQWWWIWRPVPQKSWRAASAKRNVRNGLSSLPFSFGAGTAISLHHCYPRYIMGPHALTLRGLTRSAMLHPERDIS